MKIAQLIPQFYPHVGGAEICIHNVSRKLAEFGHSATIVTSSPPPANPPDLPYQIEYIWEKTCGLFRHLPDFAAAACLRQSIARLQKKHQFDLWQITNGYPLGTAAVSFLKKHGIPSVLRSCGEDIQSYPSIGYGVRLDKNIDKIIRGAYPLFDAFVALTPSVSDEYVKLNIPANKIRIIPNGVDTAKFQRIDPEKRAMIRQRHGVSEKDCLILTVGRYHPKKGFDLIPEIAASLRQKPLSFKWLVVGRKTCEIRRKFPECESLGVSCIEGIGNSSSDRQAFSLPSDELVQLYASADIFAFPTLIETFGMVIVEAMAASLPIVTTDAEGVRHIVEDGVDGLKAKAGDSDSFATALSKLMHDSDLSRKLSVNARKKSLDYDWDKVVASYISLYEDCIAR